jgi:hypothetical protein
VAAREIAVKKYVVKLSSEEPERLATLIRSGKHPAQRLTKARILLKADASKDGEAWSDSQIALAPSLAIVARTRQQLVEEGFEAALTRKHSPASARPRVFDGAAEANLIALACSEPPKGRARYVAATGRQGCGVEHRRSRQRQHDRADAQKTSSNRTCRWLAESAFIRRATSDVLK